MIIRVIRYNLKVVFAGKFFWFLLAAFLFFAFFMFQQAWNRVEINEGSVYNLLLFPCLLLIFYPVVFGIQNDEDNRILEIIFGIPNYRYKVWGVRMLMMYVANFFILLLFGYVARLLLYPVNISEMAFQLLFPMLFSETWPYVLHHYPSGTDRRHHDRSRPCPLHLHERQQAALPLLLEYLPESVCHSI
jgi:hypothetical protein